MRVAFVALLAVAASGCVVPEDSLAAFPDLDLGTVRTLPDSFEADTCLVYDGDTTLVGGTVADIGQSGATMAILVRGGNLTVAASFVSGAGEPGPHIARSGDAVGGHADDGGSIVLLAPDGYVHLKAARVELGNGGHGGSAESDHGSATGGDGGDGGLLVVGAKGVKVESVRVDVGQGGQGGSARILRGDADDASTGGDGGDSGFAFRLDAIRAAQLAEAVVACADVRSAIDGVLTDDDWFRSNLLE